MTQTDPPLITPFTAPLKAAVVALYACCGQGHVSAQLEVCQCPVCMTEDTRQQIIATPSRALSPALIAAYSNSAHGVPNNTDDLRLLMPRYLDLMAEDDMVDDIGVGTELLRFGDALRMEGGLWSDDQRAALEHWAQVAILHFGYADAMEMDNLHTPLSLAETLLCGGWTVDVVTGALESLFDHPDVGRKATSDFAQAMARDVKVKRNRTKLDWFALRYVGHDIRRGLKDWLNDASLAERIADVATDPATEEPASTYLRRFLQACGTFDDASFPARDD